MNKPTALLVFVLISITSFAQDTYHPTVIEGATWVHYNRNAEPGDGGEGIEHFALILRGDTIVEGVTYKKLIRYPLDPTVPIDETDSTPYVINGPSELYALIREDTINFKVYGRVTLAPLFGDSLSPDTLIHDFSLGLGQLMAGVYNTCLNNRYITEVDFKERYGKNRRIQYLPGEEIIQGVGSDLYGLFYPICEFRVGGEDFKLIDYCIEKDCPFDFITSTSRIPNVALSCSPNPTANEINFDGLSLLGGQVTISIYGFNGRLIRMEQIPAYAKTVTLQLGRLPAGIYLVHAVGAQARSVNRVVKY